MLNWCENNLGVAGPYKKVQKFIESARGEPAYDEPAEPQPVCFQKLYPAETSKEEVFDPTPSLPEWKSPAWYKDQCCKWGCYWDANYWDMGTPWTITNDYNVEWEHGENEPDDHCCATIRFDTAWCPPVKLFDKVAQDYPNLTFRLRYKELSMCFKGVAEWRNGVKVKDESSDWEAIDALDWN